MEQDLPETSHSNVETRKCFSVNRKLFVAKTLYVLEYAKEGCHWPYLMLFYVSLGLDPAQAGLINGLRYLGSVIGAPLLGFLADRKKCHKMVAIMVCSLAIIFNCLQPFVPFLVHRCDNGTMHDKNIHQTNCQSSDRLNILFFLLLVFSFFGSTFDGSTLTFADSSVMKLCKLHSSVENVGRQRTFAPVGSAIGSSLSSLFITYISFSTFGTFSLIFAVYFIVTSLLAINYMYLYSQLNSNGDISETRVEEVDRKELNTTLRSTLRSFKTWFFLFLVVSNGIHLAVIYSFTFLFLQELKSSTILFAFADVTNAAAGIVFFVLSKPILRKIGPINGMTLSFFAYGVRYIYLAYLQKPELVIIIHLLTNGLTCSLFACSYLEFIRQNFPPIIHTFMLGLACALYNNFGYFLANIFGGEIYKFFGARILFKGCATMCFVWSFITFIFDRLHARRRSR